MQRDNESARQQFGKLGLRLKTPVTIQGIVVDGPFKGFEGGPNIRVQRINGTATQEDIQIKLTGDFDFRGMSRTKRDTVVFEFGRTYELQGYEFGEFVGGQPAQGPPVQTTARYFRHLFQVERRREIPTIQFSPADFTGRVALLEGTALTVGESAYLVGNGWLLLAKPDGRWSDHMIGRRVEVLGEIGKGPDVGIYEVRAATPRLVALADQLGRKVSLRGTARSLNDRWWFNYRGQDLYVENMQLLPGWTAENHYRPVEISGTLDHAELPDVDEITRTSNPRRKEYFIVREATWKPIDKLLAPERARE